MPAQKLYAAIWLAAKEILPSNPKAVLLAVSDMPKSMLAETIFASVKRITAQAIS